MNREIEVVGNGRSQRTKLQAELAQARQAMQNAEAELAEEQAQVNAFRMHCRLKLDLLIDSLMALRLEKQTLLTRLQLLRQAQDMGIPFDQDDPFWRLDDSFVEDADDDDGLLLPTDTPRDKVAEKRLYRQLARRFHPDLAKSALEQAYRTSMMAAINNAYTADNAQALYDLAGELEPAELAELATIETVELRRLREQILKCRHLQRKALRQLRTLRQENTAQLWRRALLLDENDQDYWSVIRREIETAVARRESELKLLRDEVAQLETIHFRILDVD